MRQGIKFLINHEELCFKCAFGGASKNGLAAFSSLRFLILCDRPRTK